MSKRKLSPLATVLLLLESLSPEEIGTLGDFLRGRQPRKVKDPKSPAPVAEKKSGRRSAKDQPAASTEGSKANVGSVSGQCAICGNGPLFEDHDPDSQNYHIFRASLKKKNDKGNSEIKLPDVPEDFSHGATV